MANAILFISYLDKICLTLTGNLWRALACLYSEPEAIKGSQDGFPFSVDCLTCYRQHLCGGKESRPQQHTWNSEFFVLLPLKITAALSLHFQHLMKTKGYFQDTYSEEEAFSVPIVHINS